MRFSDGVAVLALLIFGIFISRGGSEKKSPCLGRNGTFDFFFLLIRGSQNPKRRGGGGEVTLLWSHYPSEYPLLFVVRSGVRYRRGSNLVEQVSEEF